MKIRLADKFDIPYFISLIKQINDDDSFGDIMHADLDENYLNSLFTGVIHGSGICYIAESDTRIGLILGFISPNVWKPDVLFMHEAVYYVDEEYRNTRAGYLLFKAFDEHCQKLLDEKKIHHVTLTAPKTFIDMDFTKFNYEVCEKTWIRKGMRYE